MSVIAGAHAQQAPDLAALQKQQQQLESTLQTSASAEAGWWNVRDAMTVSSAVLIFGFLALCITAFLIRAERDGVVILRILATVLIITFTVFLIVAGYSDRQIAPAMGLLGTIAGYLLGRETSKKSNGAKSAPASPP